MNEKITSVGVSENVGVLGEITARFYDQSKLTARDRAFNSLIRKLAVANPKMMKHYRLGELVDEDYHKNVICNTGFNAFTRRMVNDFTYTGYINKMALGTGVATPAATDVKLVTEAYRNTTASGTFSNNEVYLTAYFTEAECSGTYTEFGNFIDGAVGADTGKMWSHIGGLSWVKTSLIVLVVSCKYTFASV